MTDLKVAPVTYFCSLKHYCKKKKEKKHADIGVVNCQCVRNLKCVRKPLSEEACHLREHLHALKVSFFMPLVGVEATIVALCQFAQRYITIF